MIDSQLIWLFSQESDMFHEMLEFSLAMGSMRWSAIAVVGVVVVVVVGGIIVFSTRR